MAEGHHHLEETRPEKLIEAIVHTLVDGGVHISRYPFHDFLQTELPHPEHSLRWLHVPVNNMGWVEVNSHILSMGIRLRPGLGAEFASDLHTQVVYMDTRIARSRRAVMDAKAATCPFSNDSTSSPLAPHGTFLHSIQSPPIPSTARGYTHPQRIHSCSGHYRTATWTDACGAEAEENEQSRATSSESNVDLELMREDSPVNTQHTLLTVFVGAKPSIVPSVLAN